MIRPRKTGRPSKPDGEKSERIKVSAPAELIAMASAAGLSPSAMYQFVLKYATTLLQYGVVPEGMGRGSNPAELDKHVRELIEYRLSQTDRYEAEKQAEADMEEAEVRLYTRKLIEVVCAQRRKYKDGDQLARGIISHTISQDPSGRASYNDIAYFLGHWDDGRRRTDLDKPRSEGEIKTFIEAMMTPRPPGLLPLEREKVSGEN